ncbi:DUF6894 family protein [uncultured Enterovirga sp.]|uniref:DUF6894 family protein n=1 Tax=uncultured Enterovirga sp. TaxID=2026352 RepID=UPI0035CBDDBC
MPRYFFDVIHEGDKIRRDVQGLDLPDLDSAEIEAMEIWKRLRSEWQSGGTDPSEWSVEVADESGALLARMPSSMTFWRAQLQG